MHTVLWPLVTAHRAAMIICPRISEAGIGAQVVCCVYETHKNNWSPLLVLLVVLSSVSFGWSCEC